MTELGYVEGENIIYDVQVNLDPAEQQKILEQFVADEVDLIFTFPTGATIAAKAITQGTGIPVILAMSNLEGTNLVESVRQPGGNITGVHFSSTENTIKRFEILRELAPQAKRVYVTYNENYPPNQAAIELLRPTAETAGVTLVEEPLTSVEDIQVNLEARAAADDIGMDAILILPDDLSQSPTGWPLISQFAAEHNVPIGAAASFEVEAGAIFSYVPVFFEIGELAAPIADKIFKGTPAGTIPMVTPENHLRLNYKLAQELGLTVPEGLLSQAAEIIR